MVFDRATGNLAGASAIERLAALALLAGSKTTASCHHRGFSLGCRALATLTGQRDISVRLNEDASFAFPFGDGYWSLLLDRSFSYEDDVNRVLASVADVDYAMIDCGANFGFWSVLASSGPYGARTVVAVEPSSANFAKLRHNADLNGGRFEALHLAVGSKRGIASLEGHKHEARRVEYGHTGVTGERVEVVTINDLLDHPLLADRSRLIVKLDVEGMEIAAINGGSLLFERETILIVEDHGSDRAHTVSRYILDELGLRVVAFDPLIRQFVRLDDVSMLDRIKQSPTIGYNVFATNSSFWKDRLQRVPPRALRYA